MKRKLLIEVDCEDETCGNACPLWNYGNGFCKRWGPLLECQHDSGEAYFRDPKCKAAEAKAKKLED